MTGPTDTAAPIITVGADPELFLVSPEGKFISAIGLIGGTKAHPRPIGADCAVQEDNVAVEFNIPPAKTVEAFLGSINYSLEYLTRHAADSGLLLAIEASKSFDDDQLQHLRARVFGCDPDFNAWTKKVNEAPTAKDLNLRSAGGHVHIGTNLDKVQIIRWCDVLLGLPAVFEDDDKVRKELYGKAGAFRDKPYGVEYRTLSNYWLRSEKSIKTIYERVQSAADMVAMEWELSDDEGDDIQRAINTSDEKLAATLLAAYGC